MGSSCAKIHHSKMEDKSEDAVSIMHFLAAFPAHYIPSHVRMLLAETRLSNFKYKEKIGSGRFSNVYHVIEYESNMSFAMKEIFLHEDIYRFEPCLKREHEVMEKMKSPWLVEMLQYYDTPNKRCLLMQLLPGPCLVTLARNRTLSLRTITQYTAHMLLGVYAVHAHGYMHRDIKLSNFLADHSGNVKLCDFGSCTRFVPTEVAAKIFPQGDDLSRVPADNVLAARLGVIHSWLPKKPRTPHGTSYYCAPEVIRQTTLKHSHEGYSYLCDFWSLGVCIYYLTFNKLPFYSDEKVQLPSLILHYEQTLKFPEVAWDANVITDLIRGLLTEEITRLGRVGVHEIASHPLFARGSWNLGCWVPNRVDPDNKKSMDSVNALKAYSKRRLARNERVESIVERRSCAGHEHGRKSEKIACCAAAHPPSPAAQSTNIDEPQSTNIDAPQSTN